MGQNDLNIPVYIPKTPSAPLLEDLYDTESQETTSDFINKKGKNFNLNSYSMSSLSTENNCSADMIAYRFMKALIIDDVLPLLTKSLDSQTHPESVNHENITADSMKFASAHKYSKIQTGLYDPLDIEDDISYYIKNGYLLAINNINFVNVFEPRYGAYEDVNKVLEFFKNEKFEINCHLDQSRDSILALCESIACNSEIAANYNCFMMVISSHGNSKGILGSDGNYVSMKEITAVFNGSQSKFSNNKPKIFLIQACRGTERDHGKANPDYVGRGGAIERDNGHLQLLPTDCNVLIAHSTSELRTAHSYGNYPSNKVKGERLIGSWFFRSLLKVFGQRMYDEDLLTLFTRVNREMIRYGDKENVKQVSSQISQLTYKVYFQK